MLLSLSKELNQVSEVSSLYLSVADSSVLASSLLRTHKMGSSVLLQVLMFYPGSQRAISGYIKCNSSVFPSMGHLHMNILELFMYLFFNEDFWVLL